MECRTKCYKKDNSLILENGRLQMVFYDAGRADIIDMNTGTVFADGLYHFEGSGQNEYISEPQIKEMDGGSIDVIRNVASNGLLITLIYHIPSGDENVMKETITLKNKGDKLIDISRFICGFTTGVDNNEKRRICEVPFRYHTETGDLQDYSFDEFVKKNHWYSTKRNEMYDRQISVTAGAEGWAVYGTGQVLSVTKYNVDAIEWSLAKAIFQKDKKFIRFGGAGIWKLGDPEPLKLQAGQQVTFGETTYKIMDGDWASAYKDYRMNMQEKGHDLPDGYNPPVHWDELYNNPYWYSVPLSEDSWHAEHKFLLEKMYTKQLMMAEAKNAHEFSCGCLFLDPGWDTSFSSNIWDEKRMGNMKEFAAAIKEKYGLKLGLHTPLAPWTSNVSYTEEQRRMSETGLREPNLCVMSEKYIDTKVQRLKKLYEDGAYFMMYDGSWYDGPCYDTAHGHSVPSTRQEHVDAVLRIQQKLHEAYPNAVIEQHDPITGPGTPRYTPLYYMHGKKDAFDEIWGFEYMNEPLEDLFTKRAFSLYYYNLAYNIPLYLHIDLRKDNKQCLMLWWYISTCRHLGIGGLHEDEKIRQEQKNIMAIYHQNKSFFTRGSFYGVDELTHIHTLSEENASIVNCFNLDTRQTEKMLSVKANDLELSFTDNIMFKVSIPPKGHSAYKIDWSALAVTAIAL